MTQVDQRQSSGALRSPDVVSGETFEEWLQGVKVIDVDTHLIEPPDLWLSRMSAKWGDRIPHVKFDPEEGDEAWYIGDQKLMGVAALAQAGWHQYPPDCPLRWEDIHPSLWEPRARAELMDRDGVAAQVLYPNLAHFGAARMESDEDSNFYHDLIRAYNDYQTEYAAAAPGRFVPITAVPFWDVDLVVEEMGRCHKAGHRGIAFSQDPTIFGLPRLADEYWNPMWAYAQEAGLSVNFHIAFGGITLRDTVRQTGNGPHTDYAAEGIGLFLGNSKTIVNLICGGVCHRYPELNFVSVESGVGWLPFVMEALDWQWERCGVQLEHPEFDLTPTEYFKRQIYGCFWFERDSALAAIDQIGADNILYESDFPHPTAMTPGPGKDAWRPNQYIAEILRDVPYHDLRKILSGNAARIYNLDLTS